MSDVTMIFRAIEQGDATAAGQLLPLVYDELRRLAAQKMTHENPGQTLQATALVHEAYIRLVGADRAQTWDNRGHFFAAAAEAMRRILVEKARRKNRVKHGGDLQRIALDAGCTLAEEPPDLLPALDAALCKFAQSDPEKAQLVKLRYFAGLTVEQAAELLGISRATAVRHWTYARAWLFDEIGRAE